MGARIFREVLDSTQTLAIALARSGEPAGTRVVAGRQSAGVGRSDHSWASPPGGLYVSLLVPSIEEAPSLFPLALGLALHDALRARWSVETWIKWPNDLLTVDAVRGARKLGGVLVERGVVGPRGPLDVVGVGLNANTPLTEFPPLLQLRLTTLSEARGGPVELPALEEAVVRAVDVARSSVASPTARSRLAADVRDHLFGLGRPVTVDGILAGRLAGVDAEGAAEIDDHGFRSLVLAGDLAVVEGS